MAIRTFVKNLFAKITGKERREKEVVMIRFRHYQSSARMLARFMGFLNKDTQNQNSFEHTDYIYIRDIISDFEDNANTLLLLNSLNQYGLNTQFKALKKVVDNYHLALSNNRKYIVLLWSLFYTPSPPMS